MTEAADSSDSEAINVGAEGESSTTGSPGGTGVEIAAVLGALVVLSIVVLPALWFVIPFVWVNATTLAILLVPLAAVGSAIWGVSQLP